MDNRDKEEKLVEKLKDPTETNESQIVRLINKTIKDKHKVYCATDWHLWVRKEKNKPECHRCKNFETIIKNVNETLTKDDLLIYLGDLVDGEFKEKEELKAILKTLPGKKILVMGNNDLFTSQFYKSCGFEYVTQSFVWNNVLFTHMPVRNNNQLNVHGHIHGYRNYWITYSNQIDLGALDGRIKPVELKTVITSQKSYSKTIKEHPEKFNEGYTVKIRDGVALFNEVMDPFNTSYLQPDPYPAE